MISNIEKDIMENLKNDIGYEGPKITQEQFDNMVDYIIEKEKSYNPKELIWRLCICYEGLNFNKVVDIFVNSCDSYYISELVSCIDGNLDQEYLVTKMIETNDYEFISESMTLCFDAMLNSLDERHVNRLKEFCDNNR